MPTIRLTQRRINALRPRRKVRDFRDAELKGYGVRVMPSGAKRYFIHTQYQGRRVWKTLGDAATLSESEARAQAKAMLTALRDGREPETEAPGETPFETVADEVFASYGRRWKPRTLGVNRNYLRCHILPFFAGRPIGAISREEVQKWFRSLQATPAAREPFGADPVGHHAAGGGVGIPPREQQPLQGYPALQAGTVRTLLVPRGIPPPRPGA